MDEAETKHNLPPLTSNEAYVVKRNRIQYKYFKNQEAFFDRESARCNVVLKTEKISLLNTLYGLKKTTGSAFNNDFQRPKTTLGGIGGGVVVKIKLKTKPIDRYDINKMLLEYEKNEANNKKSNNNSRKSKKIVFEEGSNAPMRPIPLGNLSVRSKSATFVKQHQTPHQPPLPRSALRPKRSKSSAAIDMSTFVFEDQRLYKLYLSLCKQLESMPRLSDNRVRELKKRDPVFARRFKTLSASRTAEQAPNFYLDAAVDSSSVGTAARKVSRVTMVKRANDIVNAESTSSATSSRSHVYKLEMENAVNKTRIFMQQAVEY